MVVLNAVVGIRDEHLAQAQAGKAQISLADLCGKETSLAERSASAVRWQPDCRVTSAQARWSTLPPLVVLHVGYR